MHSLLRRITWPAMLFQTSSTSEHEPTSHNIIHKLCNLQTGNKTEIVDVLLSVYWQRCSTLTRSGGKIAMNCYSIVSFETAIAVTFLTSFMNTTRDCLQKLLKFENTIKFKNQIKVSSPNEYKTSPHFPPTCTTDRIPVIITNRFGSWVNAFKDPAMTLNTAYVNSPNAETLNKMSFKSLCSSVLNLSVCTL